MSTAAHPSHVSDWRHRAVAVHTRTEVLGLALIAGAVTLTLTAGLASGIPFADAAFLIPMAIVPAVGAVVAWRFDTIGRSIGLVLGLGSAVMTFWLGFGLLVPASFVEFTSATAFVLGVGLTLYGGIASLVRRTDVRDEPARTEVLLDRIALALVVLAFAVSLPMWLAGRTSVDSAAAAGLEEVVASNIAFEDLTIAAADGAVVVRNTDAFAHTFTIDALGIDVALLPGSSTIVPIDAAPGSYTFYCIPHSAEGGAGADDMAATLTIE